MIVLLHQAQGGASDPSHLAHVESALARAGAAFERLERGPAHPASFADASALLVTDALMPASLHALRLARRAGVPTALLMDGVLEWRNTHRNPRVGPSFLRPAPADLVLCAGAACASRLTALGNRAVATGLPRLERAAEADRASALRPDGAAPVVLVATANTPAFDDAERRHLLEALAELRDALAARGATVLWRLTGGLDADLGVPADRAPLAASLAAADAVLTTPSTLAIEAMLAERPCAIVDPFAAPCWVRTGLRWRPVAHHVEDDGTEAEVVERDARLVVAALLAPDAAASLRQESALARRCVATGADAARRVVAALAGLAGESRRRPRARGAAGSAGAAVLPEIARGPVPPVVPKRGRRAVSVVLCQDTPVGGVTAWSRRMGNAIAALDRGWEWRTLLVASHPRSPWDDGLDLPDDPWTHRLVIDWTADPARTLLQVRDALRAMAPDVVVPNYGDLAGAAAMALRADGARTVNVAHTDSPYYRELAEAYGAWEHGVAVSGQCRSWLAAIAGPRPVATIVYGVPRASAPRLPDAHGPLRLAYVGRMVNEQKRIDDLLELVAHLRALEVPFELHMVGDGHELPDWIARLRARFPGEERVVLHGRRTPEWVETFLKRIDVSVLVSAYEGTSISMLEAMAQGVVPCVTRVDSGVGEQVRDGENGIVVEVGDMAGMARRLAALAADRAEVARLGAEAWASLDPAIALDGCAARWLEVLERTMDAPAPDRAPPSALRLAEPWRWGKRWADDPAAADDAARALLVSLGARRIAAARPHEGCDAVLVGAEDPPATRAEIEAWQARGLAVAVSPTLRAGEELETAIDRLRAIAAAHGAAARLVLYGTGQHTRRLFPAIHGWLNVTGFVDDAPPPGRRLFGRPVATPAETVAVLDPDVVVLSSDAHEDALWERSAGLRHVGVPVERLYGPLGAACSER